MNWARAKVRGGKEFQHQPGEADVDHHAARAHQAEHQRPAGNDPAAQLGEQQAQIVDDDPPIELAAAGHAARGRYRAARRSSAASGCEAMTSNRILKPSVVSRGATRSIRSRRIMKKPLTGSLTSWRSTSRPRRVGEAAAQFPGARRQARRLAVADIAAGDHQIDVAATNGLEHARQQGLVMLQVGVDHGDVGRGAGQGALDHRARPGRAGLPA